MSPIHRPSSSLTCIAMLRSSSVGTTRIGTTVPPRSIDPRLFQARATRPRPRSACATDDSEAARTRRVPRRGPVPLCRSSFAWDLWRRCARSYKVRMSTVTSTSSRVRAAPNGSDPARTGLAGNGRWDRYFTQSRWLLPRGSIIDRDELTLFTDERRRTNERTARPGPGRGSGGGERVDWSARR